MILEKQWGENPEITVAFCNTNKEIALPFFIRWWVFNEKPVFSSTCFSLDIEFLCFQFHLDIWKHKKKNKIV